MAEAAQSLEFRPVPMALGYEIEQFLRFEARVLDEERYQDWLGLFTEDARYVMPVPNNTYRRNRRGATTLDDMAIYNEGLADLKQRAAREETGLVWLNDPPTRHVRLITNVEVEPTDDPATWRVYSKFMLFRARRERDLVSHVGSRVDLIRRVGEVLRIAHRTIHLPERVILDKNLNTFF
jgi:ethylbenzene dioxygenase subunit beta